MNSRELEIFTQECLLNQSPETIKISISLKIGEIRRLFSQAKISVSDARNSILKLVSLSIFGAKIDFGFDQILLLLESKNVIDIRTGYLGASLLLPNDSPHISKLIPIIKLHLSDFKNCVIQSLALSYITTMFDENCLKMLVLDIAKILTCCTVDPSTRMKAIMIIRSVPRSVITEEINNMITPIVEQIIQSDEESLMLASVIYLQSSISLNLNQKNHQFYFNFALNRLVDIYVNQTVSINLYLKTPVPWYIMQLLKILELKYSWTKDEEEKLESFALKIFQRSGEKLLIREAYSYLIVFSQLMNLITKVAFSESTVNTCIVTLSKHLKSDRINILLFALSSLLQLISTRYGLANMLVPFKNELFGCLKNTDINVAKNAAMVLEKVGETSPEQCKEIILEMFDHIMNSPNEVRIFLCDHIASMAKSIENEVKFFIDIVFQLLKTVGDICSDNIWKITVRAFDKEPNLRPDYINTLVNYISVTPNPPEALIKLAVYIFGEEESVDSVNTIELFASRFQTVGRSVQAMILSSLSKVFSRMKLTPIITQSLVKFFSGVYTTSPYPEVSQRAFEYLYILTNSENPRPFLQSKTSYERVNGEKLDVEKFMKMSNLTAKKEAKVSTFVYVEGEFESYTNDETDTTNEEYSNF